LLAHPLIKESDSGAACLASNDFAVSKYLRLNRYTLISSKRVTVIAVLHSNRALIPSLNSLYTVAALIMGIVDKC